MKILHVITSLSMGGAEKLLVDLIPRFNQQGIECEVLSFDGSITPFRKRLEEQGVKVMDFGKPKSAYNLSNLFRLIPILRKYDIVHTHNTAPQLFAAIGSVLCSVVLCTTEHTTSNRRRDWTWYAPVDRWMYNRYRKVICISEKTERNLLSFIGHSNAQICTINNGIDVSAFTTARPARLKEDVKGCEVAIIQVAGFRYQKDQSTVIRALNKLPSQYHLFLVGDGEKRDELETLVKIENLNDRVHFLGLRTDVPNLLKASDYVVMSSHWEGFGLAAVEGMAAGKPVLASDIDGLREVVQDAGLLFPHGDADELSRLIIALDTNDAYREEVIGKCKRRAAEFDISLMAKGYLEVYNSIFQ